MKQKRNRQQQTQRPTIQREPFGPKTLMAGVVDGLIILVIYCTIFGIPDYAHGKTADSMALIILAITYTIGMNISPANRTVGRMVIGIK